MVVARHRLFGEYFSQRFGSIHHHLGHLWAVRRFIFDDNTSMQATPADHQPKVAILLIAAGRRAKCNPGFRRGIDSPPYMHRHMRKHIVVGDFCERWLQVLPEGCELRPHSLFDALHTFRECWNLEDFEILTGKPDLCHTYPSL